MSVSVLSKSLRNKYTELDPLGQQLASALSAIGIGCGDTVSTLMFNNFEHCLLFYTLALMGVCIAPLNRTERPKKLDGMIAMFKPRLVFVDSRFVSIWQELAISQDPTVRVVVCNGPAPSAAVVPTLRQFITQNATDSVYHWPRLDENTALGVGFTSGSTGGPKAVVYSHRSTYIHLLMQCSPDVLGLNSLDVMYPLPPMFHCLGKSVFFY